MKSNWFSTIAVPFALAGLLLASGCKKNDQQTSNEAPPSAAQPASSAQQATPPPPPSDQAMAPQQGASPAAAPAPPPVLVIPAGTHVRVRLDQDLGSKISQPGEAFTATVADPVIVNGATAIRAGARASGTVIDAKPLGRFKGGAVLAIRLDSVRADGRAYALATSTIDRVESGKGKRTAGFIGGGAGLGALIGGLAGGGKGALIGGLVGAGGGTAGTAFTGNHEIVIPAETPLTFRLEQSVHVTQ